MMTFFDIITGRSRPTLATVGGYTTEFLLEVAKGNVPNHSILHKFGGIHVASADALNDVWDVGSVYQWAGSADITHIKQSADQAAMRSQRIELQGLDNNWGLLTQVSTLNSSNTTTPVQLDTPMKRVFRKRVLANVVATGNIQAVNSAGSIIYSQISSGNNQTLMALYSVASNYDLDMLYYWGTVVNATNRSPTATDLKMWVAERVNSYEFQLKHADAIGPDGARTKHESTAPFPVAGGCDIKLNVVCNDQPGRVYGGFGGVLVKRG